MHSEIRDTRTQPGTAMMAKDIPNTLSMLRFRGNSLA